MLAVQRVVMALILDPETPGGLRLSMDCRIESSSATADDMLELLPTSTARDWSRSITRAGILMALMRWETTKGRARRAVHEISYRLVK